MRSVFDRGRFLDVISASPWQWVHHAELYCYDWRDEAREVGDSARVKVFSAAAFSLRQSAAEVLRDGR